MALAFRFPHKLVSEAELAKQCCCLKVLGSLASDVFRTARRYELAVEWLKNTNIEMEVEAALDAGCPVLANVQLRLLPYYLPAEPPQAWHSVLIVGLDERYVYLHDPDPQGGPRREVKRANFFAGWAIEPYSAYRL
jgi:uncharacterized protein YvpB